jgi:transcriptional regulator with XRE-family HTH domain
MFVIGLKKFRHSRHLTLEELSELSGISTSQLSRLEADNVIRNRSTTLATIEKIALALKIC